MAPKKKANPTPGCPEDEIERNLQKIKDALEEALETGRKAVAKGNDLEKKEKKTFAEAEEALKSFERSCSEKIAERDDLIRQLADRLSEYEEDTKATITDLNKKFHTLLSENDSLQQEIARQEARKLSEDDAQQFKDKAKSLRAELDTLERKIEEERKEATRQKRKATTEHNKEKKACERSFEKQKKELQLEFEKEKQILKEVFAREKQEIQDRESAKGQDDISALKHRIKELENDAMKAKTHKRLIQSRLESQKKSIMNVMRESSPILPIPSPLGRSERDNRMKSKRTDDPPPRKSPKVDASVEKESTKENIASEDPTSEFVVRRRRRRVDLKTPPQRAATPPRMQSRERFLKKTTPPSDIKVSCVRRFGKSKSRARSIAAPHDITNTHTPVSHDKKTREPSKTKNMAPPPKASSAFMDLTFSPLRLSHTEF